MYKVGFVVPTLNLGGAERMFIDLASRINQLKVEGFIVTLGVGHPGLIADARKVAPVYMGNGFEDRDVVARRISNNCDILITWAVSGMAYHNATCGIPVIEVVHNEPEYKEIMPAVLSAVISATHVVGVSSRALQCVPEPIRHLGAVIYNGIDLNRVGRRHRSTSRELQALGIPADKKVALFLGRWSPIKGFDRFISACKQLGPEWVGVMASKPAADAKPEELLLLDSVKGPEVYRVDPVDHPGDLLSIADCLVMPSRSEAFPLVMLEAMAARVPVVMSDLPIYQELKSQFGDFAFTVPNEDDPAAFAEAITAVDGRFTDRAWRMVVDNFSADAMAQRWEDYLLNTIDRWRVQTGQRKSSIFANQKKRSLLLGERLPKDYFDTPDGEDASVDGPADTTTINEG